MVCCFRFLCCCCLLGFSVYFCCCWDFVAVFVGCFCSCFLGRWFLFRGGVLLLGFLSSPSSSSTLVLLLLLLLLLLLSYKNWRTERQFTLLSFFFYCHSRLHIHNLHGEKNSIIMTEIFFSRVDSRH